MYYRSVNRGISFTKAGRYTVGLVLALGFFATGSGYNGLYLSLSLGLALLIISGLLSEKVMKFCLVESLSSIDAEAETPFSVIFHVTNSSPTFSAYGVEFMALGNAHRFGVLTTIFDPLIEGHSLRLDPNHSIAVTGHCSGLKRGHYRSFPVAQRTAYPFGLLIKFRMMTVPTSIRVLPRQDPQLAEQLRNSLRGILSGVDADREFHSHKLYVPGDPLRRIDWKKSSGANQAWVVKQYESQAHSQSVTVEIDGNAVKNSPDAATYEMYLSRTYTACQVILEFSKSPILTFASHHALFGEEACQEALVEFPTFESRERIHFSPAPRPISLEGGLRVRLDLNAFSLVKREGQKAHG